MSDEADSVLSRSLQARRLWVSFRFIPTLTHTHTHMTDISDSHYQSTLDAVYVYVVPWSEFPFVPSYSHCPHAGATNETDSVLSRFRQARQTFVDCCRL